MIAPILSKGDKKFKGRRKIKEEYLTENQK